jgi:glycerol-3-phosphate dehydrogenase
LITITGGKWTTYRKMGEDTVNRACELHGLKARASATKDLKLHGWLARDAVRTGEWSAVYGADLPALQALVEAEPELGRKLHPSLPFVAAEVIWAARYEMARCTEDVLARRTRALFMDARAAIECAPAVATLLAKELGRDEAWRERDLEQFNKVAAGYLYVESSAS